MLNQSQIHAYVFSQQHHFVSMNQDMTLDERYLEILKTHKTPYTLLHHQLEWL